MKCKGVFHNSMLKVCTKIMYQTGQVCLQIAVHSYVGTQTGIYMPLFWCHKLSIYLHEIIALLLVLLMKTSNYHCQWAHTPKLHLGRVGFFVWFCFFFSFFLFTFHTIKAPQFYHQILKGKAFTITTQRLNLYR